ncbi:DUF294 nucleotidyltransferase-like domain-containing protein [Ruegeria sp. 2205SS24-7]|uniref:DUF294 nucleotidyltransferase-like domain-containing protein n=1 Tax=Ruegeria discodermiae TaxID=3064389 RepID=UPI002740B604|nr:DUF294 nucleotidyltransferase-like domain-containing protein [Ruegeria sp. 2205SS24-7]MDP5215825.1 DUF294 nucleotidyltransferase-like domain-containing protein [Ruegeria sp. 2205SS24-7]
MSLTQDQIIRFLRSVHPYDALQPEVLSDIAAQTEIRIYAAQQAIYRFGEVLPGLFVIHDGSVEVIDENGEVVSNLGLRNSFGERGLLRDGKAATSATASDETTLLMLPAELIATLRRDHPIVARFFHRERQARTPQNDLATSPVETLMARDPAICAPDLPVQQAAQVMRDRRISSLCVVQDGLLRGIVTIRDLSGKVVAQALPSTTPVGDVMTAAPMTLPPSAIGSDVLHMMMEHRIGHVPITESGRLQGIVTQTDLTRFQAVSSAEMVAALARADTAEEMAAVTAEIPRLLVQLVAGGNRHDVVTRLITDIADTATRRLLALAEAKLGPPPVPYLWLACGSQGRQEQTGVSDQDNCLMLDDSATEADMAYFAALAKFVCDGLNTCGYVYCPGEMMATNPRWCQPVRVWRDYFAGWIAKPNPEAQMLASVMFDLRPIGGDFELFKDIQANTLSAASANSIFVAHMISNALKHSVPLGLFRGLATIRSGEHRDTVDMKHNGVVPVVDLGRLYALRAQLTPVNTRARLDGAERSGALSPSGARDLRDAYDLIADARLEHQAAQVKAGLAPDNFMAPGSLSDFERSHLRDAFVVVKTMQSAIGHGKGMLG